MNKNRFFSHNARLHFIGLLAVLLIGLPSGSIAGEKVALIIGNSAYENSPLDNPVNDAADMGGKLRSLGFKVEVYTDLDRKSMRQAIREFGEKLKKSQVGLFYYAGHGIQVKGRNYLIPIKTDVRSADEVEDESIDAGSILRKMESAGNDVNIVILDACRNNPFSRSFRSLEQGLARMDGPVGSLIAYATAPGSVAADGTGRNGLYTRHLLNALDQTGLTIEQTFKVVRNEVRAETDGKQIPWESSSLTGEFSFFPVSVNQTATAEIPPPPKVTKGHLQIISNVPNAKVLVNNINRGLTDSNGVLNISSVVASETVVSVEAMDHMVETKNIKIMPGKWQQLRIDLEKQDKQIADQAVAIENNQTYGDKRCFSGKKAAVVIRTDIYPLNKEARVVYNNPTGYAALYQSLKRYGPDLVDTEFENMESLYKKLKSQGGYKRLGRQMGIQYLVYFLLSVREEPITAVKTNMKTIYGESTLKLVDLKKGQVIGNAAKSFRKAGTDMQYILKKNIGQHLDRLVDNLVGQLCS